MEVVVVGEVFVGEGLAHALFGRCAFASSTAPSRPTVGEESIKTYGIGADLLTHEAWRNADAIGV